MQCVVCFESSFNLLTAFVTFFLNSVYIYSTGNAVRLTPLRTLIRCESMEFPVLGMTTNISLGGVEASCLCEQEVTTGKFQIVDYVGNVLLKGNCQSTY